MKKNKLRALAGGIIKEFAKASSPEKTLKKAKTAADGCDSISSAKLLCLKHKINSSRLILRNGQKLETILNFSGFENHNE